ncbi:MAG: protein-tyrosine phosphatase [Actinomycetota bacterium]|jgi:protein-tyrosine phosphatase
MAEGILRTRAAEAGLELTVSSAGIYHGGAPATDNAVAVCADRGVDISNHVSRRLDHSMIEQADLVIAMTREHLREAVVTDPTAFDRTFTLRELVRRLGDSPNATLAEVAAGRDLADYVKASADDDVADPVGQSRRVYETTVSQLDGLLSRLVAWMRTLDAANETKAAS